MWVFFVLFLQLLCKAEIISKGRIERKKKLFEIICLHLTWLVARWMSYQTKIKFSLQGLIVSSAKPDSKLSRVSDIQGQGCFCCSLAAGDSPLPCNTPDPFILRGWSIILEFVVHQPGTGTDTLLDQQGLKWVHSRSRGAVTLGKISFDKQGFNGTLAWWTSVGAGSCSKDWSELFDSVTALYLGEGRSGRSTTIDYYIFMKSERYWNSSLQTWTLWYCQPNWLCHHLPYTTTGLPDVPPIANGGLWEWL